MKAACTHIHIVYSQVHIYTVKFSDLEQCRVKKLTQGFNAAAQLSNWGPLSRESEALPLSHCALEHLHIPLFDVRFAVITDTDTVDLGFIFSDTTCYRKSFRLGK